jgi:hypothetical protein
MSNLNVDYKGVEIGDLTASTTVSFVPGRAVRIASSLVTTPTAGTRVLGLIKEWQYSGVLDEISGGMGIYGSGKASVICSGIVTVQQAVINGVSYNVYDETKTYASNDRLYATATTGILTNVKPANDTFMVGLTSSYVGKVLVPPTNPANGDAMQITVDCLI